MRRRIRWRAVCANALLGVGALLLLYSGLWEIGLAPGSRFTLPAPVALAQLDPSAPLSAPVAPAQPAVLPTIASAPALVPAAPLPTNPPEIATPQAAAPAAADAPPVTAPTPAATLAALSAQPTPVPTPDPALPPPGYAVRLTIPSIHLDTQVEQGGIVLDRAGNPEWETQPFVAVHYGDLTALVGAPGNAVIAGHVATLYWGNVFINLYRVQTGDLINVMDDQDALHTYQVNGVRLVDPSDVSPLDPTPDPTLTLITCGGTFDPVRQDFSARLIVTADLVPNPTDDSGT